MAKMHFVDIARDLTEGIASGRLPVGSTLPTELELCDHYKTSRHTVRAALQELQRLGLVSRKKNVGTRVASSHPTNDFRPSLASLDDLVQFGAEMLRSVQSTEAVTAGKALADKLGCPPGTRWVRISSLRIDADGAGTPIGWTDVYIDPAYAEIADQVRQSPGTLVSSLLEARYGRRIDEVDQEVRAIMLTPEQAVRLNSEPGSAALEIVRRYLDAAGQVFEISVTVHPAQRFVVSMRLKRSQEA
nr:GntR family transcriptional regulator [Pandoraea terrae]